VSIPSSDVGCTSPSSGSALVAFVVSLPATTRPLPVPTVAMLGAVEPWPEANGVPSNV